MKRDKFGRFKGRKKFPPPKRDKPGRFQPKKKARRRPSPTKAAGPRRGRGVKPPKKKGVKPPSPSLPLKVHRFPTPPSFRLYPHKYDDRRKVSYRIDATSRAPPPIGHRAIPKPGALRFPSDYNPQTVAEALRALLKKTQERGKRRGYAFQWWRIGLRFIQPADDGRTYLANATEERTGPMTRFKDFRKYNAERAWVDRFMAPQSFGDASRVSKPLLLVCVVNAIAGNIYRRRNK